MLRGKIEGLQRGGLVGRQAEQALALLRVLVGCLVRLLCQAHPCGHFLRLSILLMPSSNPWLPTGLLEPLLLRSLLGT